MIFAGIQVSSEGYSIDPARLDTIREYRRPRTNKELQQWLGLYILLKQFAASPLKERLSLQRHLLWKNYSNKLKWKNKQVEEFETERKVMFDSSQMLCPFDPTLAMGLVVNPAKTTGIGYILFQFNPRFPPACELADQSTAAAGPMNFSLQGVCSVSAKGLWADLSPVVYEFVDHQPFAELYGKKQMSKLSPRMLKLLQELMENPFVIRYTPGRGYLIGMVEALSRAPYQDASTLCSDPLDLQYHPINQDQAQTSHEACFAMQALGSQDPCPYDPSLRLLYKAVPEDEKYRETDVRKNYITCKIMS